MLVASLDIQPKFLEYGLGEGYLTLNSFSSVAEAQVPRPGHKNKAKRQFLKDWKTANFAGASASVVAMNVTFIPGRGGGGGLIADVMGNTLMKFTAKILKRDI